MSGARTLWVGTSWKMTKTLGEAVGYVDELVTRIEAEPLPAGIVPFVLPAATALATVRDRLGPDSPVVLGAQNAHWGPEGAATGEVSMRMVADVGARLVEVGHSERRAAFGETDSTVARKVAAALEHDLTPLVCVGEPAEIRASGGAEWFVAGQVEAALSQLPAERSGEIMVAYEPIWAIGEEGRAASASEIAPVLQAVGEAVGRCGPPAKAVLYGGSVDHDNAAGLLLELPIDGLFVGRAAWTAAGFGALLSIAAAVASGRSPPVPTPTPTPSGGSRG